jgi:hypothetical protein
MALSASIPNKSLRNTSGYSWTTGISSKLFATIACIDAWRRATGGNYREILLKEGESR